MNDIISRNIAIKAIVDLPNCYNGFSDTFDKACIIGVLEELAPIDAVQVVRCKDCKWYDMTDSSGTVEPIGYRCKKVNRLWREPDDFCKGAERREECG